MLYSVLLIFFRLNFFICTFWRMQTIWRLVFWCLMLAVLCGNFELSAKYVMETPVSFWPFWPKYHFECHKSHIYQIYENSCKRNWFFLSRTRFGSVCVDTESHIAQRISQLTENGCRARERESEKKKTIRELERALQIKWWPNKLDDILWKIQHRNPHIQCILLQFMNIFK